jgi:copper(I)-binding protein
MTLTNASVTPYALTSVSLDAAGMVEIHETSMNGEMMKMRQVSQIDIPANGSVELKPGSYHVMLMGLKKGLTAGATEILTLTFSDNSQKTVEASVGDLSE